VLACNDIESQQQAHDPLLPGPIATSTSADHSKDGSDHAFEVNNIEPTSTSTNPLKDGGDRAFEVDNIEVTGLGWGMQDIDDNIIDLSAQGESLNTLVHC
jgi:hypothetical protein